MNHRQITVRKRKFQTGNGGSENFVMDTSQFFLFFFFLLFAHFFLPSFLLQLLFFRVFLSFASCVRQQQFLQFLKFFYGPAANGVVLKILT